MKKILAVLVLLAINNVMFGQTNETEDYVEFDDRKNVVHGVYLGFNLQYGRIDKRSTGFGGFKLAYVANQQIEFGVAFKGFYNQQKNPSPELFSGEHLVLVGGYGGFHVEPILFGKNFLSVSFPILIGGGLVTYTGVDDLDDDLDVEEDDFDDFVVVEPGINILYNFTRYTQLETGIRYRFTSEYDLSPYKKDNLNGFSVVVGLKVGIFNMGRKKPIKDTF